MEIYATSKNTGPSWGSDPRHLLYLGADLEKAKEAVGDFSRYEIHQNHPHFSQEFPELMSAIPRDMEREMIHFYSVDGWWYSIVKISIPGFEIMTPEKIVAEHEDYMLGQYATRLKRRGYQVVKPT